MSGYQRRIISLDGDDQLRPLTPAPTATSPIDAAGLPVGWRQRRLITPAGEEIPYLVEIDQRLLISPTLRLCKGTESACSKQCPLTSERQNERSGCPCPLEVKESWDLLHGLAVELKLDLRERGGAELPFGAVLDRMTQIDLVREYVFLGLLSLRNRLAMAKEDVFAEAVTVGSDGSTRTEIKEHPGVGLGARLIDLKLKIAREFLSSPRGQMEATKGAAETGATLAGMLADIAARLPKETLEALEALPFEAPADIDPGEAGSEED
jgi:hypothetical protein